MVPRTRTLRGCIWRSFHKVLDPDPWPLTCTGSAGLVTGLACAFLLVMVEPRRAALLAPIPLQTGEGGESMWHHDTHTHTHHQSCDTVKMTHCQDSLFQPTAHHHHHHKYLVNWVTVLRKLLTSNNMVNLWQRCFLLFLWWYCKMETKIHFSFRRITHSFEYRVENIVAFF